MSAGGAMLGASAFAAHGTRLHFIRCEDRRRLLCAVGPVHRADQTPRCVGAVQVARAVHVPIHYAHGLMRRADGLAAARALRHLVDAHGLVGPALAVTHARGAQPAAALGRVGPALLRMPIADEPPAAAAGLETGRAGGGVTLPAHALVLRAMVHPARRNDPGVLRPGGPPIAPVAGHPIVDAEG